jgi:hypothetical protein
MILKHISVFTLSQMSAEMLEIVNWVQRKDQAICFWAVLDRVYVSVDGTELAWDLLLMDGLLYNVPAKFS